ncbi:hypothetical protein BTVI_08715 [Pitangus sulphuratus]|nr:hypothetical protein BTVI_08715 [Pitangus sulphuratus]
MKPLVILGSQFSQNIINAGSVVLMNQSSKKRIDGLAFSSNDISALDMLEGRDVVQRDLDKIERWAHVNLLKFNKVKCKVLYMDQAGGNHLDLLFVDREGLADDVMTGLGCSAHEMMELVILGEVRRGISRTAT